MHLPRMPAVSMITDPASQVQQCKNPGYVRPALCNAVQLDVLHPRFNPELIIAVHRWLDLDLSPLTDITCSIQAVVSVLTKNTEIC